MSKRTGSLPQQPQRQCRQLVIQITFSNLRSSPLLRSYGPHAEVHQSNSSNSDSNSDNDNNNDPYFMNKAGGEEMMERSGKCSSRRPSRGDDQDAEAPGRIPFGGQRRGPPTGLRTLTAGGSTSTSSSIRSPSRNVKKEDSNDDEDYNSESVRKRESGRTINTSIPSGTSLQESGRTPCFRDFNALVVLISNRYKILHRDKVVRSAEERSKIMAFFYYKAVRPSKA